MNWSSFYQFVTGASFGSFGILYLIVLIKGLPEAIKSLKEN